MKQYTLTILLEVDPDANFLELENGDNTDVIAEIVSDSLYDIDDIKCLDIECEVER